MQVYKDPFLRTQIQQIWRDTIREGRAAGLDTSGERWVRAKKEVEDLCLEATRARRRKHASKANVYRALLDRMSSNQADTGPSEEFNARRGALKDRIEREEKKAKAPRRCGESTTYRSCESVL